MAAVCRTKGEGAVDYMWPKPGREAPQPKVSYVKLHADWGWIIGSGIYVDDVQDALWAWTTTFLWALGNAGARRRVGGAAIRGIVSTLMTNVTSPRSGSTQVASAANQVASSASQSLAEGASEQAASLEETPSWCREQMSLRRQAGTA